MMTIDVIVPVFGNWRLTESCLRHLAAQTVAHRTIVVDDCSPDDTLERLRAEFPDVTVVAQPVNGGFARACNAGFAAGVGEIVVLVNNDVDASHDLLERLAEAFEAEDVGSAVPLLTRPDGRIDAYGLCADPTRAGFVRLHGRDVREAQPHSPTLLGPYGAVAAYRRAAIEQVGFLDEGIVMYGEELDLALRLRSAGWGTAPVPEARGVHIGGATTGRKSRRQRRMAGFGRGYMLRAYGIMRSRWAVRALVTELGVSALDAARTRDFAALSGRLAGWRAGRGAERRLLNPGGIDESITFLESVRLRTRRGQGTGAEKEQ